MPNAHNQMIIPTLKKRSNLRPMIKSLISSLASANEKRFITLKSSISPIFLGPPKIETLQSPRDTLAPPPPYIIQRLVKRYIAVSVYPQKLNNAYRCSSDVGECLWDRMYRRASLSCTHSLYSLRWLNARWRNGVRDCEGRAYFHGRAAAGLPLQEKSELR